MNELPIYHGPCPYCGSAISVVIQDGTTVARCSHRGCGARGPIMRSTERAVELFRAGRFASQAQAAQSVLDATARAEAAERELAAEREAHELEKRAHEHTWQQKVRQIERAEAAEKRAEEAERECAEAWDVQGMAVARAEKAEAKLAEAERERDTANAHMHIAGTRADNAERREKHWRTVAEEAEKQARLGWERAAEKDRAYGDMIRDRDHWRTVAESRPDISREDAGKVALAPTDDLAAVIRVSDALRDHAAAPKGDDTSAPGPDADPCIECDGKKFVYERSDFDGGTFRIPCPECNRTGRAGGGR